MLTMALFLRINYDSLLNTGPMQNSKNVHENLGLQALIQNKASKIPLRYLVCVLVKGSNIPERQMKAQHKGLSKNQS